MKYFCARSVIPNTGGIRAILLISCRFHFWLALRPPPYGRVSNSTSKLHYRTGHGKRSLLTSRRSALTPFFCLCVYVAAYLCAWACAPVTQGDLFPIRKWNSLRDSPPLTPSEPFSFITSPAVPEPLGVLPRRSQLPDKHRQHLSCGQKCWVAITSQQTT